MKKFIQTIALIFAIILALAACTSNEVHTGITTEPMTALPTNVATFIVSTATEATQAAAPTITMTEIIIPEPTDQRTSSIDGMPEIYIPEGTFRMGGMDVRSAPDEMPAHDVTLSGYWMDQLEVTNAMYMLCVKSGTCKPPQSFKSQRRPEYFNDPEFNDYPVIYVTWGQAKTYCEWAQRRLPTEAEWEHAARGNDWRTFPWGEDKADGLRANYNMLVGDTSRVGTYPLGASPFGILDMAGNVAEWTNDFYNGSYYARLTDAINPLGPETGLGLRRVVRGGSLGDAEINIRVPKRSAVMGSDLRSSPDSNAYLGEFSPRIGFRCAADE
jgi:formylglycine-generating enzyme required for sulfatase activity